MASSIRDLLELAEQNEVLDDTEIQQLVLAGELSENEFLERTIRNVVLEKSLRHRNYPFNPTAREGELQLGKTPRGTPFKIPQDDLVRHLLAVGQSGSGKTTLFYNLMEQLRCPFWVFDRKQDYRHLINRQDLYVIPWTELKFNPLKPPKDVPPRRWAQVFSEIFSHATALLSGSKNYLLRKIIQLYRLYNLFDQVSKPYPSLHELEKLVKADDINYVRKQSNYRDTLLNRIEAMNLVAGTIFDCSRGYPIHELLQKSVVFEFDGLSRDLENFLTEILFAYVYEYRLAQNHRNTGLNHLFFLDEAKQIFSVYKEQQEESGIPEIDELTAKMREFGEGLVVADQEASKLTDSIKANTYTKILLPTGDRKQFRAVTESMNLTQRQAEYASQLGTGEAVIQSGNTDPVPVELSHIEPEKSVSDSELEKYQRKRLDRLSHEPRQTTPDFDQAVLSTDGSSTEGEEVIDDPDPEIELTEDATTLLQDIVGNPFSPLTERYQLFSSNYKGNKAKNELVDQGVVVERYVRTGEKRKLLELTEKGRRYAEDELETDIGFDGKGGIVHRYWQHRIKELFEDAGWSAFLEKFDADVYINMNDVELVVEVAMGDNPREIDHIRQHLEAGFTVWVACRNEQIRNGLRQRLKESSLSVDSIVVRPFQDFNNQEMIPEDVVS